MMSVAELTTPQQAPTDAAQDRLTVRKLNVGFARDGETRSVVREVSFALAAGRCVAIVGESGSGKSVTARTLAGLTGAGAVVDADPTGATAVPGVWVAGNVTDLAAQLVQAAAGGGRAGSMINADLLAFLRG